MIIIVDASWISAAFVFVMHISNDAQMPNIDLILNCGITSCFNFVTGGNLRGKVQVHVESRRRPGGGLRSPRTLGGCAKLVIIRDFNKGK